MGSPVPLSRSLLMSRIKSKDTKPELAVRSFLHRRGFRYALHRRDLPGTPDIVLPKYRSIVFVHGCLWHGHVPCSKYLPPRTHREYWIPKIHQNRRRDARQRRELRALGWQVLVVWECQVDSGPLLEARLRPLLIRACSRRGRLIHAVVLNVGVILMVFALRSLVRRISRAFRRLSRKEPPMRLGHHATSPFLDPLSELREP